MIILYLILLTKLFLEKNVNYTALAISPFQWWEIIEFSRHMSIHYAKELFDYDFSTWLSIGEIRVTSNTFSIYNELSKEREVKHFRGIEQKSKGGTILKAKSLKELHNNELYDEEADTIFIYSIKDLNHICSAHFNMWLILNDDEILETWRLYFEFIIRNSDENHADVYKHFWLYILNRLDIDEQFEQITHYREFLSIRDQLEAESNHIERAWITKRDSIKA